MGEDGGAILYLQTTIRPNSVCTIRRSPWFHRSFVPLGSDEGDSVVVVDALVLPHLLHGLTVGNDVPVAGTYSLRRRCLQHRQELVRATRWSTHNEFVPSERGCIGRGQVPKYLEWFPFFYWTDRRSWAEAGGDQQKPTPLFCSFLAIAGLGFRSSCSAAHLPWCFEMRLGPRCKHWGGPANERVCSSCREFFSVVMGPVMRDTKSNHDKHWYVGHKDMSWHQASPVSILTLD
jgi:hypothetical protein